MFITFAFPYMNGPLHIGHLYTLLNGWVAGRHKQCENDQPMFMPFGFHCTGMPIYASANKLKNGDKSVAKMLLDLDIPADEIHLFEDPEHWVRYFPKRAMDTLKKLNLPGLDLSRSFVTTSVNPYFNKFVEWQYTMLKKKDLIVFGKRPSVWSMRDSQPCAAHDRQIGEQSVPVKISDGLPEWIKNMPDKKKADYLELCKSNQNDQGAPGDQGDQGDQCAPGDYYVPSEEVISRSGDLCIVATTEQWYINYSNAEWKEKVKDYITNTLIVHDQEVHKQLIIATENMHDWCISREYGLGTKIPWDNRFVIDSLSDSTIYPIYYNICHLLQGDIMGSCPGTLGLQPEELTPTFFNEIFNGDNAEMRQDLRVSGKDLIYNHLVMMIYHGIIFGEIFLPKEYRVNGYVRVNGEKMSKSLGNFITIEQALEKYPKDSLMMLLMEAGDGVNDANVRISDIEAMNKSLERTREISTEHRNKPEEIVAELLEEEYAQGILECYNQSEIAWNKGRIREAITYGWRKAVKYYESFKKRDHPSVAFLNYLCACLIRKTLLPILCDDEWRDDKTQVNFGLLNTVNINPDIIKLTEYFSQIKKLKPSLETRALVVHHGILSRPGNYERIMKFLEQTWPDKSGKLSIVVDETIIHEKRDPFKIKPLII